MFASGPYLQTAVLCEKVLQEADGVLSLIRIVDREVITLVGPKPPEGMPSIPIRLYAVLALKSGGARGRHQLALRPEQPSGIQLTATEVPVYFEGEDRGVNAVIEVNLMPQEEGLFWFDVLLDGSIMTRIPLRVIYQPVTTNSMGGPGQPPS